MIDGSDELTNVSWMKAMKAATTNSAITYVPVPRLYHFRGLLPVLRALAWKVTADKSVPVVSGGGPGKPVMLTAADVHNEV